MSSPSLTGGSLWGILEFPVIPSLSCVILGLDPRISSHRRHCEGAKQSLGILNSSLGILNLF
ncbi:MAG: hypothetical protein MR878_06805 [Campylobacter sp.]|nr:hypothetical protein [Campylobacter sp.]